MSPSILVVEAYDDLRSAIVAALLRAHFECEVVASGSDAIDRLRAHHYDAVLLAPRIPITTDPVVHFIEENQPAGMRTVVLMTNPDVAEESTPAGCRVLAKPFSTVELIAKLSLKA